jgi:uncharacterized membrane protein YgcG
MNPRYKSARINSNARTQMPVNSAAGDFSDSYVKEKIVSRLIASIALLAAAAGLAGCAVAPGYDYAYGQPYYAYGQPYYPGYGYAYGPPYYPGFGTVGIYGGWGGCCYYHGGHGYWHGHGGGHGGWHGGGYGGHGGSAWSGGGHGSGGHGH